jgi:hypothetical protein
MSANQLAVMLYFVPLSINPVHVVRFEGFTALTMQSTVFWHIKDKFVPRRKHITSPLQSTVI